jgi:integrating conjugative element protein (TIGR03755 family)
VPWPRCPALIIQRADPGLYNLLTNGVLQARLDFDRSKMTCRAIANRLADMAGGQAGWDQLAEGMTLRDTVTANGDAVSAVEQAESNKGNNGVPWVGGSNAGGSGQGAIKVVGDVTRAGYNLLNGRGVTDTSAIPRTSCSNRLTCQTWASPDAAAAFAVRVLGEREQRTCESCTKTQTTPGVGLTPVIQEEYETKLQALQELVTGAKPTTTVNLEAAGSNSLPITRGVIEALRDEPDQDLLGKRLASEAALSSVLEKALLLQRTLLTGKKEPNVAANELAVKAVDQENSTLEQEINNLKTELELRRTLASNSPMAIVQRHGTRAGGSRGIFEGDTTRDRLKEVQKPRSTP